MDDTFLWGDLRRRVKKQIIHILQQIRTSRELYIIQISLQDLWEIRRTISKTLRHYCQGELFFFPSEGRKVLASFINWNTKEYTAYINYSEEFASSGNGCSNVWGLGTTGRLGITMLLIAQRSWTNLYPQPLGFLTGKIASLQELVQA